MKKNILILSVILFTTITSKGQDNALYFDGVDDVVVVPNASSLIAGSNQLSMSCWIYPENAAPAYPDYDGFCGFRNNLDADLYFVQITADTVEARFRNSSGLNFDIIDVSLQMNTWQQYVLTYDGSLLSLYKNGQLIGSTNANGSINSMVESFNIGDMIYNFDHFFLNGKIDEVSLWNKSLTAGEVQCIYQTAINPASGGLVLYYKFDQGIANTFNIGEDTLFAETGTLNGPLSNFALHGTTSNWTDGVGNNTVTDSLCDGGAYPFGPQIILEPGMYSQIFLTPGCDSIVRLILYPKIDTAVVKSGDTLTAVQQGGTYEWVDCDLGYSPVGVSTASFIPSITGNYAVIIALNGCSDTSACRQMITKSDDDIHKPGLTFLQNTSNNQLIFSRPLKKANIKICDSAGRIVYSATSNEESAINISFLSTGIYIIKLTDDSGDYGFRFVVGY